MQSFAFDPRHGEIYAVQVEAAHGSAVSGERDRRGDLTLSRLSADGKTVLGHMILRGFGHGVAIGVQPAESGVLIWSEVDSRLTADGASARGARLGRFAFVDGATLEANSSAITKYSVAEGASNVTPSIDVAHGYFAARFVSKNQFHVALFKLADVELGRFSPIAEFLCPDDLGTFQGWATWGSYVYFYAGNNYSETNPPPGNAVLACYDWNTGREAQRAPTEMFRDQLWREPEGMAVRDVGSHPQLVFGFASHAPRTNRRVISLAAIEQMVP